MLSPLQSTKGNMHAIRTIDIRRHKQQVMSACIGIFIGFARTCVRQRASGLPGIPPGVLFTAYACTGTNVKTGVNDRAFIRILDVYLTALAPLHTARCNRCISYHVVLYVFITLVFGFLFFFKKLFHHHLRFCFIP